MRQEQRSWMCYDILSRVVNHDNFKSFKPMIVINSYFCKENNNILIPNVGFKFLKAGIYIIELDLKIKIRRDRNVKLFYLNYIHNKTSYLQYDSILNKSYDDGNIKTYFDENREHNG